MPDTQQLDRANRICPSQVSSAIESNAISSQITDGFSSIKSSNRKRRSSFSSYPSGAMSSKRTKENNKELGTRDSEWEEIELGGADQVGLNGTPSYAI